MNPPIRNQSFAGGAHAARVRSSPARRRLSTLHPWTNKSSEWKIGQEVPGEPPDTAGQRPALATPVAATEVGVFKRALNPLLITGLALLLAAAPAFSTTYYVWQDSPSPGPPYADWSTAAHTIQEAADAAATGDEVVVTNGIYASGGRAVFGTMTNRVAITNALTLRSVNGPQFTIIQGYQVPGTTNGNGAIRCVYLTNGAVLKGFTLSNGATRASGDILREQSGGGVSCASASALVTNCLLTGNSAARFGGGAFSGTLNDCTLAANSAGASGGGNSSGVLNNCVLAGNAAGSGGGAFSATLNNCTLTGNSATSGGGAFNATLRNCILYYNSAASSPNYSGGLLNYCCTTPLPGSGTGNISAEPQLASASHLSAASPCRGAGSAAYATGLDIDGESWLNPPSIGCDEYHAGAQTGDLNVAVGGAWADAAVGAEVDFTARIDGRLTASAWDFGDGTVLSNRPYASHTWGALGNYTVVLRAYNETHPDGVSATVIVHVAVQAVYYVSAASTNPVPPYFSWATAARTIQAAVDAAPPGTTVLVSNGIYASGGRAVFGSITNRVAVEKPLTLRSVNGPQVTFIKGYQVSGSTNGDGAIRCAYLTSGGLLSGFTLTNGATTQVYDISAVGGGVYCDSAANTVSNCVLMGNSAYLNGGAAYGGTLNNCLLAGNSAQAGGGANNSTLNHCVLTGNSADYGGGTAYCTLRDCTLSNGLASYTGGGTYSSTLNNCTVVQNMGGGGGGGVSDSALTNCTVTGNSAYYGGGASGSTMDNCRLAGNSAATGGGASEGTLINCTLTGNLADTYGGGAYGGRLNNCTVTGNSANEGGGTSYSFLTNCVLIGNSALYYGGGVWSGVVNNSALTGNSADSGGGAYSTTLANCTVTGNSATSSGGGVVSSTLNNCVLYYNKAPTGANYAEASTLAYCCTTPDAGGPGNITDEPQLASASHLSADSPCLGRGSYALTSGVDIDGEPWANPPAIGCDEYHGGSVTGEVTVTTQASYSSVAAGFAVDLQGAILGRVSASRWEISDGTVLSNRPFTTLAWNVPGDYVVTLRAFNESSPGGVTASRVVRVVPGVYYVARDSAAPAAPYTNWTTAARTIQEAVDAVSVPGALVLVSNGVYQTGGRTVRGVLASRVAVDKPWLSLRSVNGPEFTIIQGYRMPGPTNGAAAIRCVYLTNGTTLSGFTLTNGATWSLGDYEAELCGGGVWCESADAIVSNCVITGNAAFNKGAGSFRGTLNNCTLAGNSAVSGGGASDGTLINSTLVGNSAQSGGGAANSSLHHCTLADNSADYGGGAAACGLTNCALTGNSAQFGGGAFGGGPFASFGYPGLDKCTLAGNWANWGGGVYDANLNNCTLAGNQAYWAGGAYSSSFINCTLASNQADYVAGAYSCTAYNSILIFNSAIVENNHLNCVLDHCCTEPLPAGGLGNFVADPLFVDRPNGNLRLQAGSPCINAGDNSNALVGPDLDGQPRITGPAVDIGAYEFQPGDVGSFTPWLQQHGLPSDGSADNMDPDGDGMSNWQEWQAGTDPTDASSALRLLDPSRDASGITVRWQSVGNRTYFLERATDLRAQPPFSMLASNIVGQATVTSFTDTNATGPGPFFYRVGVEQ